MSDQENKNEFVFEDENENNTQEYTESSYSGSTENIKSIFKNKRIVTLVGGVVIVWLLSFILENVLGDDDKIVDKVESSTDIQQATSELTSVPEAADSKDEDVKELKAGNAAAVASIDKDVRDNLDSNTATIKSMQEMHAATNTQIDRLSNQISDLTEQLSTVASANSDVTEQVAAISAKMKAKEEAAKNIQQPKLENYYIKALIHGRAWLVGPDKKYVTVSAGDEVKDYGKIVEIFPDQGAITTSSGRIIRFANN